MYKNNNGYVSGAVLFTPAIRQLREHVELEKFMARVLIDNDTTREFKKKTEAHTNRIYAFRYNNDKAEKITAAGRKNANQPTGS